MDLDLDLYGDEHIAWPSYVDFLSTFSFVLFIFIGSLIFLMHGQLGDRMFAARMKPWVIDLSKQGIAVVIEGRKIKFDLSQQVNFGNDESKLSKHGKEYLLKIARELPQGLQTAGGGCKVVVLGTADATPFAGDPFGNWDLSAKRALTVLQFLYTGYGADMRKKLVLLGQGDVESRAASARDRRVDLVLDCTKTVVP